MKIALVTHVLRRGDGQGRVNYEIARAAADAGHELYLLAAEVAPDLAAHPNVAWVPISYGFLPTNLIRYQVFAAQSWLWLAKHRRELDLVHVNGAVTWGRSDVNSVHFVHTGWRRSRYYAPGAGLNGLYQCVNNALNSALERLAFRQSRLLVAASNKTAGELIDMGVDRAKVRVVVNGVDIEAFRPGVEDRKQWGLPCDVPVALFAGDLRTYRKNLDTVLHALARVPDLHLAVAGALERSLFPAMAKQLGVADRVHFLGLRRDMAPLMRSSDSFVFPSRYEACSLVLLEAAASGKPVVTARTAGGSELIDEASGIVLENPDDVDALAEAMKRLSADRDLREEMGRRARAVAEQHSWDRMAREYLALYDFARPAAAAKANSLAASAK